MTERNEIRALSTLAFEELRGFPGAIRDSKSPSGPILPIDLGGLLAAVKTGRFDR